MSTSAKTKKRLKISQEGIVDNQSHKVTSMTQGKNKEVQELTGANFLKELNGHSWRGRHMKQAYNQIVSDLGGEDNISFAQSEIARRCAALAVLAMENETALSLFDEDHFNSDEYIIISRAQAQLFKQLGMQRKQKQVGSDKPAAPASLDDYLKRKR